MIDLLRQDKDDLKKIHANSLDLIEECGIRFHSDRALEILDGSGAKVNGSISRIPGNLVESALKKAPETFMLFARDAQHDLNLDSDRTFYSQDGCAAFTIDFESGVRRRSCKEDIEKMALISDYLDVIDIICPTVSAQDVPPSGINVHELEACFSNTGKHVVTVSVVSARGARSQIELAAVVAGGEDELRKRPIFSNFVCSISPLSQDPGGIEAALEFASAGIPVGVYSMATAGVTSPVTLAGTLAVINAEIISALALIQLAVPGAKVFYAGGPATIDLRLGSYTACSPEAVRLRTIIAELARFYGLPSIVGAGATTAKAPGEQAAWENASSFIFPSLAGVLWA
jgi:trimethylamine--corrinoid protein Co-methyltransferase